MYVRALIVVLAILNAGVALWWAVRPAASPPVPPPAVAGGVASLQQIDPPRTPAAATAVPASATAPSAAPAAALPAKPVAPTPADRCLRLGPYADQAAAEAARTAAGDALRTPRVREVADASSFKVMLTGVGDRDAAQAMVAKIKAAGLSDYYIVGNGAQSDIALGQYRSREGAERRQAELAAAGFAAQVVPSGGTTGSRWWIEARVAGDDARLRALHAPGQRSLDCAALR
ncbi:SPOR domain-containing protein [Stenotrophomonas sp. HITSZ_GD]|uniref:SPOR domain-containing protein n=1 Tax=Stenotrophomonas sp. HITSZ_GD TaxID=3037248 RepID=UPI00240D4A8E|nr:SPOR domain-containing protein [Stenotrophomonas sp. HITSZ_GD]MDG2523793.1 SPOR domain-containing protein [Stenotrophomonas sp. HITSZ_GD]